MQRRRQGLDYQETGFGSFYDIPNPPNGHTHDTFELSVFEGGEVTMLYGGSRRTPVPGRLVIHWGMLPHQLLARDPGARVVGLHLPLTWMLQWSLPDQLLARLLNLELLVASPQTRPCDDLARLRDWHALVQSGEPLALDIVLTEVKARLMRLALSSAPRERRVWRQDAPTALARALRYMVDHIADPLTIESVANAAGLSPRHMTRLFASRTGQTLNRYITQVRLSYARRLLIATDMKILEIMHAAGFTCATRFYALFKAQSGLTPRRYRIEQAWH